MRVRCNDASAIVLLGLPGSGKGTQSRLLAEALCIPALSTGDMLRHEVTARTKLGVTVSGLMEKGLLVGDDLVNEAVCSRISRADCANGFILDGYPRTVAQAKFLDKCLRELGLPRPKVVYLDVPSATVETRMLQRLQCPSCGRTYSVGEAQLSVCVSDGTALVHRADDNAVVIRERLVQYESNTAPLLDYYDGATLHRVSALGRPVDVSKMILATLRQETAHIPRQHPARFAHAAV